MKELVIEEIFPLVYRINEQEQSFLVTLNLTPGVTFYNEPVYFLNDEEYRSWNPTKSKLAASILKGIDNLPIEPGSKVLYLGVASGTTVSHVSDIVGWKGHIWGLDFAPRSMRDLLDKVIPYRRNISPILGDARQPSSYVAYLTEVDVVYVDVAQPNQAELAINNADYFLKEGGWMMLAIKSRSIDVKRKPTQIYRQQIDELINSGFSISEVIHLEPFVKDHAMVIANR